MCAFGKLRLHYLEIRLTKFARKRPGCCDYDCYHIFFVVTRLQCPVRVWVIPQGCRRISQADFSKTQYNGCRLKKNVVQTSAREKPSRPCVMARHPYGMRPKAFSLIIFGVNTLAFLLLPPQRAQGATGRTAAAPAPFGFCSTLRARSSRRRPNTCLAFAGRWKSRARDLVQAPCAGRVVCAWGNKGASNQRDCCCMHAGAVLLWRVNSPQHQRHTIEGSSSNHGATKTTARVAMPEGRLPA